MTPSALLPSPVALIVGASSGIGEALARRLAREGYRVAVLGRRAENLQAICASLNAETGRQCAFPYSHDVTHYDSVPPAFQTVLRDLGRLDVVVYASGVQPAVEVNEYNFEKDRAPIETNVLGALAWLDQAALYFERQGSGHIVGISSVAGERGRVGYPAYQASKAAFSSFLESLRNRLTRHGVHVLTVKPGMVETEMLRNIKRRMWVISPDQAAADIYRAIKSRKQVIFTPARWALVMLVIRNIPSFIFRRMAF
jgi:short-subunit dehydrogenase